VGLWAICRQMMEVLCYGRFEFGRELNAARGGLVG
jgi:hypothetical protein